MISVIIPVYNEADSIAHTIQLIKRHDTAGKVCEIIVADAGSFDHTISVAQNEGAKIITCNKGRAVQMNAGAKIAVGELLYFLHADTWVPQNFSHLISSAYVAGFTCGCFRLRFDINHWFLKANTWFTRFNINAFRFGDQSLFVKSQLFQLAGGFNEQMIMLEDQEIIYRIRKKGKFVVLPAEVITSARKYQLNGIYKTQAVYFLIYTLYRLGFSQPQLLKWYRKLINQNKL